VTRIISFFVYKNMVHIVLRWEGCSTTISIGPSELECKHGSLTGQSNDSHSPFTLNNLF